jgi:Sulfotransferase family
LKLALQNREPDAIQRVPRDLYWKSLFFSRTKSLWKWLADVESAVLAEEIEGLSIKAPIYVCGLARSGTTIITELLNEHEQVTSHRYSDFPNIYTPYWRNWLLQRSRFASPAPINRAHQDGILVTPDSAEAVEELLWMHFFPNIHDPDLDQRLDHNTVNEAFERFYRQHIAKLLLVRKKQRYLAKGNYNIGRVRYINGLFPDAIFIVPIRHPVRHIVSLYKQHKLFLQLQEQDNHTARQLAMSGHYEFGPQRLCPNFGDFTVSDKIKSYWSQGMELQGWALLWRQVYTQVKHYLYDPHIKERIKLLRYEDLCSQSESTIDEILNHCNLPSESFRSAHERYRSKLKAPDYYRFDIDEEILEEIWDIVSPVADWFGYARPT